MLDDYVAEVAYLEDKLKQKNTMIFCLYVVITMMVIL
jgi:hypothetical protein